VVRAAVDGGPATVIVKSYEPESADRGATSGPDTSTVDSTPGLLAGAADRGWVSRT
jgi:hypothetical protein